MADVKDVLGTKKAGMTETIDRTGFRMWFENCLRGLRGRKVEWPEQGPFADVYLLLVDYPEDPEDVEFLDLTSRIARILLEGDVSVLTRVRRIVCLKTPLGPGIVPPSRLSSPMRGGSDPGT